MVVLASPAKLNIFLEVCNKRNDGYHNIDSVFVAIDLFDRIELEVIDENRIVVTADAGDVPDGEKNLVYKAIVKIKEFAGSDKGAIVHIKKRIPAGGGLGGGSSNAATVIKALCQTWNIDTTDTGLLNMCASLGADIPFFMRGVTAARCRGIGEIVEPLELNCDLCFVVVNPGIAINTGSVYSTINVPQAPRSPDILIESLKINNVKKISENLFNRLEEAVLGNYEQVGQIKKELEMNGAYAALMSGSGSSVFGLADTEESGNMLVQQIKKRHKSWFCSLAKAATDHNGVEESTAC